MTASLSLVRDRRALIADIRKQLGAVKPAVVCIDTLNRSLEGSESSDEDMAAYIRAAEAIREAFNCLVVIVHHCGHDERRPRGHSSLIAAVDTQIAVSRDAAGNIIAELELSKDSEIGLTFVSRLKVVDIGIDEDGDPITSCVVEAVESPVPTEAGKRGKKQPKPYQAMLRALRRAIEEVGERVTSNTIPRSVPVVSVDTWRRYAYQAGISPTNTEDSNRMAFDRAHKASSSTRTLSQGAQRISLAAGLRKLRTRTSAAEQQNTPKGGVFMFVRPAPRRTLPRCSGMFGLVQLGQASGVAVEMTEHSSEHLRFMARSSKPWKRHSASEERRPWPVPAFHVPPP